MEIFFCKEGESMQFHKEMTKIQTSIKENIEDIKYNKETKLPDYIIKSLYKSIFKNTKFIYSTRFHLHTLSENQ